MTQTGSFARQQVLPFNRQVSAFRTVAKPTPCRADDCDGAAYPVTTDGRPAYRCTKCGATHNAYGEKDEC